MDNEKEKTDELAFLILYENARKWFETWDAEKEDRLQTLKKLSDSSGLPEKSPACLMLLGFVCGMDAGIDFITEFEKETKGAN